MASIVARSLWRRQQGGAFAGEDAYDDDYYDDYDGWWWSPAGMALRYAIVALLFSAILLYLIGGYYNTQRRIRRGQAPRPLFRWMARRRVYYAQPHYQQPHQQRYAYNDPNSQGFNMEAPPPYTNAYMPPPVYQPPEGASKAMPDQNLRGEGSSRVENDLPPPPPVAR